MMVFSPLDEEKYEKWAVEMTYLKIFKYILKDFVTRKDAEAMMKTSNLPVQTTVNTAVSAPPPSGVGTGVGTGQGNTQPIYNGSTKSTGSLNLEKQREIDLKTGGMKEEQFTAEIKVAGGGEV